MKRLTRKSDSGMVWFIDHEHKEPIEREPCDMGAHHARLAIAKLAEYEDLEEQGKLLKLPCAVGDTVYVIEVDEENFTHFHCPRKISEYEFNFQMLDLLGMFGKCIFLTEEEAEAALKELSGAAE